MPDECNASHNTMTSVFAGIFHCLYGQKTCAKAVLLKRIRPLFCIPRAHFEGWKCVKESACTLKPHRRSKHAVIVNDSLLRTGQREKSLNSTTLMHIHTVKFSYSPYNRCISSRFCGSSSYKYVAKDTRKYILNAKCRFHGITPIEIYALLSVH